MQTAGGQPINTSQDEFVAQKHSSHRVLLTHLIADLNGVLAAMVSQQSPWTFASEVFQVCGALPTRALKNMRVFLWLCEKKCVCEGVIVYMWNLWNYIPPRCET